MRWHGFAMSSRLGRASSQNVTAWLDMVCSEHVRRLHVHVTCDHEEVILRDADENVSG